jgi:hypothetical protein
MSIDNPAADEILDIEIAIDGTGIEPAQLDEATRRLAASLRKLPHENVGIVADPALAPPGGTAPVRTLGVCLIDHSRSAGVYLTINLAAERRFEWQLDSDTLEATTNSG